MPFSALARGSITSRPQRVHLSLMSMPTRVTSHIFSPQGCGFFISTRSFSLRSIALPLNRFPVLRGGAQGQHYKYPHSYPNHWVRQQYLPDELKNVQYYRYGDNKVERAAAQYWEAIKG